VRSIRLNPLPAIFSAVKAATVFLTLAIPVAAYADHVLTAPKGIDLTGVWTIDSKRSDDPQKALQSHDKDAQEPMRVRVSAGIGGFGGTGGMSGLGDRHAEGTASRDATHKRIQQFAAASERIEILQLPESVDLKFAEHYVSCTSTARAQVSLPDGNTANRTCGWDENEFVVEIQGSEGFTRTDRYSRGNAETLVVSTMVKSDRMPKLEFKSVYLRSESN
jgi:hypothetical protein